MDGLLEGVKHEAGMGGATDPPAHDIASVDVDHEGYIGEPSPRRHIGKIGDPEPVGRWGMELAIDVIERARRRLVADRGAHSRAMVFIVNGRGKPFTRKGFGNKFRDWCDEAGLSECSAHGLRKAAARRFAEPGCTNQQIKIVDRPHNR